MAAERKVTVRVDVSATGNLGDVLKQRAAEAAKVKDSVQAIPKQIAIAPASAGTAGMVQNRAAAKARGYSPGMMWDDDDVRDYLQKQNAASAGGAARPSTKAAMPFTHPPRTPAMLAAERPPAVRPAAAPAPDESGDMRAMAEAAMRRKEKQSLRKQLENVAPSDEFKEAAAVMSRKQVAIEAGKVGNEANVRAVMQEVKLEEESLHLLKQKQAILSQAKLADLRSREGQADALKTSSLTFQARGAAAATAGEQSRADRRSIGSPEHMSALKAETAARWESAKNARMEARATNIAEYGRLGGTLVTFGQRTEAAGMVAVKAFAGMVATVAAASPAALQTFLGSVQLAAGEIGIMFIPTIVQVSRFFQDLAGVIRNVNEATGGMIGRIVGPLIVFGAGVWVASKVIGFMAPAFSLAQRGMVLLTGTANTAATALGRVAVTGNAAAANQGGGGILGMMGGGKGMMGKIGIGGGIAVGGSMAANAVGSAVGGKTGDYISTVGESTAMGAGAGFMIAGPAGAAVGAAVGFVAGNIRHFWEDITGVFKTQQEKSAAKLAAFSMNFQGGGADEDLHAMFQREAIRDPMQQAKADQEARAMEALAAEIGGLKNAVAGINQSWQVGN